MRDLEKIENIFRNSSSPDELFDAFQTAVNLKIKSVDTYKILLANPTLSADEVKMFTEKLIKEQPDNAYEFNMWTGSVFENFISDYERLEDTFEYYKRAIFHKPDSHEPLLKLLNLYNYEINLPTNSRIINTIVDVVKTIDKKSKVYYALANHFRKTGNNRMEVKYLALAEKYSNYKS